MRNITQKLIGSKIQRFVQVYDYWQLITDKGSINIYNPFKFYYCNGNRIDQTREKMENLLDEVIINVFFETKVYIRFVLNNKVEIYVSLLDDDYTGPEAVSIRFNTGELFVIE